MRSRDLVVGGVALLVAAGCVRLGFWQLDRLGQRRARNAEVWARRALPPITLAGTGLPVAADSVRDRRMIARGVFDYARERVWRGRTYDGVPGVALVTPLRLADGSAVWVDRGWAPSPDAARVDQVAYREGDSAVVEGVGMRAPRGRGDVDPDGLRDSLPYRSLPFVILRTDAVRASADAHPLRWSPPALGNGPHLSYAIQWFSFAVIVLVGTGALLHQGGGGGG
ncbi:MAG: SURF1 family protein, partial [Gemmatimonadales bacterium]